MFAQISSLFARLCLRLLGWKLKGHPPALKKAVIVAYPHTSYMDGFLVILISLVYRGSIALKGDTLFFRLVSKLTGQISITRDSKALSQTEQIAAELRERNECFFYISPEGKRSKVQKIKTGFCYIAKKASIPIICGNFDYRTREYSFGPGFTVCDLSIKEIIDKVRKYYEDRDLLESGRYPEYTSALFLESEESEE